MPEELTINGPDNMLLNMGPQHPSTHGVIRFVLETDGEVVEKATPVVGYLHRGVEKIATEMTYTQFMPISDRLDYVASMNGNLAWCEAVERMAGIEVPRRAEFLRVIAAELNRISSHLVAVGSFCNDVGGVTPLVVALREREAINDLLEMLSGARLTYNYMRIGGVSRDMTDKFRKDDQEHRGIRELQNRLEGLLYTNERVMREFGAGLSTEDREEVRATLNRARKALTSEDQSVLEEAIYAVQDAAQSLTHVIMLDPVAALGGKLKITPDASKRKDEETES